VKAIEHAEKFPPIWSQMDFSEPPAGSPDASSAARAVAGASSTAQSMIRLNMAYLPRVDTARVLNATGAAAT
jgi:hypothetical protein